MKGNGNGWSTLLKKVYFMFIPTNGGRTKFIIKHSHEFKHVGGVFSGNQGLTLLTLN